MYINKAYPVEVWILGLMALFSIFVTIVYMRFDTASIRGLFITLGIFTSVAVFHRAIKLFKQSLLLKFVLIVNAIWLAAGAFQLILGKDVFSFLVVVRTSENRGVTGLAPEPTFFGTYLIFISLLLLKLSNYQLKQIGPLLAVVTNLLFIVLIAKSAMASLIALLLVCFYFMANLTNLKLVAFGLGSLLLLSLLGGTFSDLLDGYRISALMTLISSANIFELALLDESISSRLSHVVYSIHASIADGFLPHGFHQFKEYHTDTSIFYQNYFIYEEATSKIMSGLGSIMFELGWAALVYIGVFIKYAFHQNDKRKAVFELFALVLVMLTAIPLAFPLFYFLLVANYLNLTNKTEAAV